MAKSRLMVATLVAATLTGCTFGRVEDRITEPPVTQAGGNGCPAQDQAPERLTGELTILAGSELQDLDEVRDADGKSIVDRIEEETGVSLNFTYAGTLDAVAQMVDG